MFRRWYKLIEKLTVKQCKIIICSAMLLSFVWSVYMFFANSYYKEDIDSIVITLFLMFLLAFSIGILGWCLLAVPSKEFFEEEKRIRPEVREKFGLKTYDFVEVIYTPADCLYLAKREVEELIIRLGAKCLARDAGDGVVVVIKNNKGEVIKEEIVNYYYFNRNYKLKK